MLGKHSESCSPSKVYSKQCSDAPQHVSHQKNGTARFQDTTLESRSGPLLSVFPSYLFITLAEHNGSHL